MTLKKQTVNGVKWLVGSSFLQKAISVCTTIVLARILGPADFGLFALAFVAIDALGLFKSMGFDSALIQRNEDVNKAANTAFFIIPFLGIILYLILSISAPFIAKFLNNEQVSGIIRALGIIFVISCFGRVPATLLEKNIQFRKVSIIEVSSAIVNSVSALTFAFLKFGVWSLVIAYVIKVTVQNVLTFIVCGWKPRFEFDKKIALDMFHFGKFIFLGALVWFLKMNLDNLLVGKLLGVTALGLYAIAFNVANFGAEYFGGKVYRVTYPAYAKIQNDLKGLKDAALEVFKHTSWIALPLGTGFFLLGKEFLTLVYGEKWVGAADTLKILAWAGTCNTLTAGLSGVFLALNKTKFTFWVILLEVTIFFIFISPMAKLYGIRGVGIVVSFASFSTLFFILLMSMKMLRIKLSQFYSSLKTAIISTIFMSLAISILKWILLQHESKIISPYSFISILIVATLVYIYSLFRLEKKLLINIKEILI